MSVTLLKTSDYSIGIVPGVTPPKKFIIGFWSCEIPLIIIIIIIHSLFCATPTARTMTHHTVQFKSAIPKLGRVGSLEQERFQGTLENRRGTHQLDFCWQAVLCSGVATENALSPKFRRVLGMT